MSYHIVEYIPFNGKRIVMIKDGRLDLIYHGVLSRHFTEVVMLCQLADNLHLKLSPIYSADMRDISGIARTQPSTLH